MSGDIIIWGLKLGDFIQLSILIVLAVTAIIALIGVITTRRFRKETNRPRIWPTDIYLNPFDVGEEKDVRNKLSMDAQQHPLIKRLRRKTGERDPEK